MCVCVCVCVEERLLVSQGERLWGVACAVLELGSKDIKLKLCVCMCLHKGKL